jgi:leucine-rich repeat protein SHOC2
MKSLTKVLVDGIENEQVLSSIGQLKHVRKISLRGNSFYQNSSSSTFWHSPISSLILASVLYWKRLMPKAFMDWRLVKSLELPDDGLSDCATNCVDFRGLSSLEELDLSRNKFSSMPYGIS